MDHSFVDCEEEYPFVTLRMARPERKNLLTAAGMRELTGALQNYERREECRYLILTGSGGYFCFGGDLGSGSGRAPEIGEFSSALAELHLTLSRCAKITAAAVNGLTGGGGVSLVDACDFAVIAPRATLEFPEARAGSTPMISLLGVRNTLSRKQCFELIFGKKIGAQQALAWGLVNRVAEDGDTVRAAKDFLGALPFVRPDAYALCKRYYHETAGMDYEKQLAAGAAYLKALI